MPPQLLLPHSPPSLGQRDQVQGFFGTTTLYNPVTMAGGLNLVSATGTLVTLSNNSGFAQAQVSATAGQIALLIGSAGAPGVQNFNQVGSSVVTTNVSGDVNVIYPVSFPNACDVFVCCNGDYANNNHQVTSVINKGSGLTSLHAFDCTTGAAITNTTIRIEWIAWGH